MIIQSIEAPDERLEAIAQAIESLQRSALMQIAERLAEAQEIFRYRRDEGGFGGWVESRLPFSRHTAYNLMKVREQFGEESVELFDRLAPTVLYALAAPSTPENVRSRVIEHAEAGERVTVKQVKELIAEAKPAARSLELTTNDPLITTAPQAEVAHTERQRSFEHLPASLAVFAAMTTSAADRDLHTAITALIRESKRRLQWIEGIPANVTYAKADIDTVIARLQALNEDLVKRRGRKVKNRVKAAAR